MEYKSTEPLRVTGNRPPYLRVLESTWKYPRVEESEDNIKGLRQKTSIHITSQSVRSERYRCKLICEHGIVQTIEGNEKNKILGLRVLKRIP